MLSYIYKIGMGVGQLLVGIAAVIAILQAGDVLDKIINIQNKASKIEKVVIEIRTVLNESKILQAENIIYSGKNPENIFTESIIPLDTMEVEPGQIYIPSKNKQSVLDILSNPNISKAKKAGFFKENLKIKD